MICVTLECIEERQLILFFSFFFGVALECESSDRDFSSFNDHVSLCNDQCSWDRGLDSKRQSFDLRVEVHGIVIDGSVYSRA